MEGQVLLFLPLFPGAKDVEFTSLVTFEERTREVVACGFHTSLQQGTRLRCVLFQPMLQELERTDQQ